MSSRTIVTSIIIFASAFLLPCSSVFAKKSRTKTLTNVELARHKEKHDKKDDKNASSFIVRKLSPQTDSLLFSTVASQIRIFGFDKKASSAKESIFVSNDSPYAITGLTLDITYLSTEGKMFHQRTTKPPGVRIPPGGTRLIDFKSWDLQKSFYYCKSERPRNSATPFAVKIRILEIDITP